MKALKKYIIWILVGVLGLLYTLYDYLQYRKEYRDTLTLILLEEIELKAGATGEDLNTLYTGAEADKNFDPKPFVKQIRDHTNSWYVPWMDNLEQISDALGNKTRSQLKSISEFIKRQTGYTLHSYLKSNLSKEGYNSVFMATKTTMKK
jgi:hypothetical protein